MHSIHFTLHALHLKEVLLIQKILFIGIIFFLSLTCSSNVAAQNNFYSYLTIEERLFDPQELEIREGPRVVTIEPPVINESSDDFKLVILPIGLGKKEPEFDIPIVINGKVEHYIQYFQTTIRDKFITWLSRSEKYKKEDRGK